MGILNPKRMFCFDFLGLMCNWGVIKNRNERNGDTKDIGDRWSGIYFLGTNLVHELRNREVTKDIIEAFKDLKKGKIHPAREILNDL